MRHRIREFVEHAIDVLVESGELPLESKPKTIAVERSRREGHGDFACAAPLAMARVAKINPRRLAEMLQAHLPPSAIVEKTEIAGAGFINFFLADYAYSGLLSEIIESDAGLGANATCEPRRVLIDFGGRRDGE